MILITYNQDDKNLTSGNYLFDAAKQLGVPVIYSPPDTIDFITNKHEIKLLIKIDDGHTDYYPYKTIFPLTVFWAIDTHTNLERVQDIAKNFHHTFSAQLNGTQAIPNCAGWLPSACDPNVHTSVYETIHGRPFDIGFVGGLSSSWNLERKPFIDYLRTFKDKNLLITTTNRGQLSIVYGISKIVINQNCNNDINMRVFEAMSSGALLIQQDIKDNGWDELGLGSFSLNYTFLTDLPLILSEIDANPARFANLAKQGQDFVQENHSYIKRLNKILNFANSVNSTSYTITS